jgi:hypothetical protein
MHYHLAFKQGLIDSEDAAKYIDLLDEETLNRVTQLGFDRRLLKPVMETAWNKTEKSNEKDFDTAVQEILDDKHQMFIFMNHYCMNKW